MTVQRLTFVDKGQDFLWWEVDDQTGRILGCGPHQAHLWASGKCSVDMNTVAVGERPIFHGPATEPGGRPLLYRIESIRPAEIGGGVASMTELSRLIEIVAIKTGAGDWAYGAQGATGTRIAGELEAEHGARFRTDREPMTMMLGGVRASATGGFPGLFSNWQNAARRRLAAQTPNEEAQ